MQAKEPVLGQLKDKMQGMANRLKGAAANASALVRRGAQHATASTRGALVGNTGYSMAEVLATVAIIVILCGIVAMNVVSFQANLRQKELDAKAEVIYTAAQEQMTRIMASGWEGVFAAPNANNITDDSFDGTTDDTINYDVTTSGVSYIPAVNAIPGDANDDNPVEEWQICYITSEQLTNPDSAAYALFGQGGLDAELSSGKWVIEYDYKSLTVYSVFYSEDGYSCAGENGYARNFDNYNYNFRSWNGRLNSESTLGRGNHVGYHGGGSTGSDVEFKLTPTISWVNEEKLEVEISCSKPLVTQHLQFYVTLSDDYGHSYSALYKIWDGTSTIDTSDGTNTFYYTSGGAPTASSKNGATFSNVGQRYTLTLVLDSLEGDGSLRFTNNYGSGSKAGKAIPFANESNTGNDALVEGSDIHIEVEARCPDNGLITPGSDTATVNSLFDESTQSTTGAPSTITAAIKYGRHLQNLDDSAGFASDDQLKVTAATLEDSIDFSKEDDTAGHYYGWKSTYGSSYFNGVSGSGEPYFKPISNSALVSFDGNSSAGAQRTIAKLNVDVEMSKNAGDGYAGLFATAANGMTIRNTVLTGVSASGPYAGASLLGFVASGTSATIDNCQTYLRVPTDTANKTSSSYLIQSSIYAGGLVGSSAGSLTITGSSASTVLRGGVAGGLVGFNSGSLKISSSYADCYITGGALGGLVGSNSSTGSVDLSNSYAAGYLTPADSDGENTAAGLVNGTASITNSYTVCAPLYDEGKPQSFTKYYATSHSSNSSAYYYKSVIPTNSIVAGVDFSDPTKLFDTLHAATTAFAMDKRSNSEPYNLMDQGLGTYEWPMLPTLKHYGDWIISGFQPGSLVYFEEYELSNGQHVYGFEGANVPTTLKDTGKQDNNKVTVVGDGYGVVYLADTDPNVTVTVNNPSNNTQVESAVTITKDSKSFVVDSYKIYPLGEKISNTKNLNPNFYLSATLENKTTTPSTFSYYYFNPHFARTAIQVNTLEDKVALSKDISIRTARQLFNLSLFYEQYKPSVKDRTFSQERNIAYTEYLWSQYTVTGKDAWGGGELGEANMAKGRVCQQAPIGTGKSNAFESNYDGGCFEITDVSFVSYNDASTCVGMFGYVASGCKISNVVLCTDYNPKSSENYRVQRNSHLTTTATVHMGVLAGYNAGTITNCAIAGYYISGPEGTVHAYDGSSMNIGGLVGTNASSGVIKRCAADTPKLDLALTYANARAGGLAGSNEGNIANSYALGVIEVLDSKGGASSIAGFAGSNAGTISSSYCATAISVSGAGTSSYGFAPKSSVSTCTYLNGGTYSYIGRMYSYSFDTANTAGNPIKYDDLKVKTGSSKAVSVSNSFMHSQTNSTTGAYPYAGKVTNAKGAYVHYGNWQDDVLLGTLGIFYWEKEVGSGNAGYHMTYLGSYEDSSAGTAERHKVVGGSSLCTSHDDNGVIEEYGYGFYVQQGQEDKVTAEWSNIVCSGNGLLSGIAPGSLNYGASQSLKEQLESSETGSTRKFTFYAFTTKTVSSDTAADDCICLKGGVGASDKQNGGLKLTFQEAGKNTVVYEFTVSPFFANAMSFDKVDGEAVSSLTVMGSDDAVTDYANDPGALEDNQYEVRSLQQLQYINWNAQTCTVDELVGPSNYKNFPYLQYATNINSDGKYDESLGKQTRKTAEGARAPRMWLQTHDVANSDVKPQLFAPIAGAATSSTDGYNAKLYAWFGGSFNGQSYTIKNLTIKSESFFVGVFGVTAGASIKNVVLYGTNASAKIERATETQESLDRAGAYAIGGLAGVAFNYADEQNLTAKYAIRNCAVSGYEIVDSSGNQETLGEVCIGGIIGVANVNLQNCSAVTDIRVQCTNLQKTAGYGNYIRVGGLVGGLLDTIENCYSGGSIEVSDEVLKATYDSVSKLIEVNDSSRYAAKTKSTHVFLAGIAASAFSSTFVNFNSNRDGKMTVKNSYTYMTFPKMEGTIRAISMIGSLADRHSRGNPPVFKNCYYYAGSADSLSYSFPKYAFSSEYSSAKTPLEAYLGTDDAKLAMLQGNVNYLYYYIGEGNDSGAQVGGKGVAAGNTLDSRSFDDMSTQLFVDTLNDGGTTWEKVTTEDEAQMPIPGKYSFPSTPALEGKDYPFPTVIKQKDLTFSTTSNPVYVNVHYGDWPFNGAHWAEGRASMDIFSDMDMSEPDGSRWAYKEFTLYTTTAEEREAAKSVSNYVCTESAGGAVSSIAEVVGVAEVADDEYKVKVRALNEGVAVISLNGFSTASFTLQITANWKLSAEDENGNEDDFDASSNTVTIARPVGDSYSSATLKLYAKAADVTAANDFTTSKSTSWNNPVPASSEPGVLSDPLSVASSGDDRKLSLTRMAAGPTVVTVTAVYDYHDVTFEQKLFINVTEPGVAGLSNGAVFNEVPVGSSSAAGQNYAYPLSTRPSMDMEAGEYNLFLYDSLSEDVLQKGTIKSIRIAEGDGEFEVNPYVDGVYDKDRRFFVAFDDMTSDDRFNYKGGTISYIDDDDKPTADLNVEVVISYSHSAGTTASYTLKVTVPKESVKKIQMVTLTYTSDGAAEGVTVPDTVNVPKGSKVTLASPTGSYNGGTFKYWADAEGAKYEKSSTIALREDTVLNAVWSHTITLCVENDDKTLGTFSVINGDTALPSGYERDNFQVGGYELEGWYTAASESAIKVLNPDGTIANDADDLTAAGKFALASNVSLYAKWKHTHSIWVPVTSIDTTGRYLLVDSNTAGGTAHLAYQESSDKATHIDEKGSYLGTSESFTISNTTLELDGSSLTNYIDSDNASFSFEDGGVWVMKASGTSSYEIWNEKYEDCYLAENDYQQTAYSSWTVFSLSKSDNLAGKTEARKQFYLDNSILKCVQGSGAAVVFFNNTAFTLATNNNNAASAYPRVRLYKHYKTISEDTFTCPSITLMNGSSRILCLSLAPTAISSISQLGTFSLPKSSSTWELQGWYASKEEDAEPVLNADGTATEGALALMDDTVLYAKWVSKPKAGVMSLFSRGNNSQGTVSWEQH